MADETEPAQPESDPILIAMERKYSFHAEMAQKILRDITEYKRFRSEYQDAPATAPVQATEPATTPVPPSAHTTLPSFPPFPSPPEVAQEVPAKSTGLPWEVPAKSTGLPWRGEAFDGTFAGLVRRYRTDSGSSYFKLHWKVRKNYDVTINKLMLELGHERISDLSASKIQSLYDGWKAGGKISTAHSYIAKVRLIAAFGTTALNDDACAKLSIILSKMEFEVPQPRHERLTAEQATAIRVKAHEMGRPSIALAQALQYDIKLKQVETIGEWIPVGEADGAESDVVWNNEMWVRGLRWSAIDGGFLRWPIDWRHPDGEQHVVELKTLPMVKEELELINSGARKGPMVICEWTGKPWKTNEFRRWWRKVADAAGVPKDVKNMDNRPDTVATGRIEDSIARASKEYLQ